MSKAQAYYNEIDPFAAQWLRNLISAGLIAPGVVDQRSIEDVRPSDLAGFTQCHFFAGIGVWSYALLLAGWPTPQAFDSSNDGAPRALRFKGNAPSEANSNRNPNTPGSYRGDLKDYAGLASWATPSARDHKSDRSKLSSQELYGSKGQPLARQSLYAVSGQEPIGSTAETANIGLLNPAHSRWLQGLPPEWDVCGAMVTLSTPRSRKPSSKPTGSASHDHG